MISVEDIKKATVPHYICEGMKQAKITTLARASEGREAGPAVYSVIWGWATHNLFEVMDLDGNIHKFGRLQEVCDFINKDSVDE